MSHGRSGSRQWFATLSRRTKGLVKRAESQGWQVDCTSNGHVRFTAPTGHVVIGPSAGRAKELDQHYRLTVKRLRAQGFDTKGQE